MTAKSRNPDPRLVELAQQIDAISAAIERDFDTQKASEILGRYQEINQLITKAPTDRVLSEAEMDELERIVETLKYIHDVQVLHNKREC